MPNDPLKSKQLYGPSKLHWLPKPVEVFLFSSSTYLFRQLISPPFLEHTRKSKVKSFEPLKEKHSQCLTCSNFQSSDCATNIVPYWLQRNERLWMHTMLLLINICKTSKDTSCFLQRCGWLKFRIFFTIKYFNYNVCENKSNSSTDSF